MAAVTSAVVSAGVAGYNAYQSWDAAQDAAGDAALARAARHKQAKGILGQIRAEEELYEEESALITADNLLQQDKLDLQYDQQVADFDIQESAIGLKEDVAETGLTSGLEQTLMQASTGFKQSSAATRAQTAVSGFAGSGVGADAGLRETAQGAAFAQQGQVTGYGQTMDALALSGEALQDKRDFALSGHDLSEDILEGQFEREKFGAYKDFESTKGELKARRQSLLA